MPVFEPETTGFDPTRVHCRASLANQASAFALLLGMGSVTTTSDTIRAVLIGGPGTAGGSGHGAGRARTGQAAPDHPGAGGALGAACSATPFGGVFGAVVLALSLPVVRPLVLYPNHGDFLATTLFGLTLVAPLSGSSPLRGILAALLGWLVAHTGLDPHEGAERRTFGQLYLWDGVPVAILFLGIFGVSELALIALRGRVQMTAALPEPGGLRRGGDLSPGGRSAFRGDCRVAGAVGSAPAPLRPEGGWASALIFGSGRSSRDLALRSSRRGVWPGRQPLSLP